MLQPFDDGRKMSRLLLVILLLIPFCLSVSQSGIDAGECKASTKTKRQLNLSIRRKVDESDGKWVNSFSAWRVDPEESTGDITLDVTRRITECDGLAEVHVEANIKETGNGEGRNGGGSSSSKKEENLVFHHRHGKNAVILDNGRSVQKLELGDPLNAVVFSNRPLRTNELFEVRLEKRASKASDCLGIGIMIHSPEKVVILKEMYRYSNGTWMYHNNGIYQNSKRLVSNYGHNIDTLQVRERVGVMRRDDGELHFFVNGVDQGSAAANIPEKVYGIVELWHDAVKAKIIY